MFVTYLSCWIVCSLFVGLFFIGNEFRMRHVFGILGGPITILFGIFLIAVEILRPIWRRGW